MDMWDEIHLILAPGATRLLVHPIYSADAQVNTRRASGWWTSFVHCGPAAPLPDSRVSETWSSSFVCRYPECECDRDSRCVNSDPEY
jgi:hypothetical protein